MEKILSLYMNAMTKPQSEWSEKEIQALFAQVSTDLHLDLATASGCAKAKVWAYAILGQATYGKRVRKVMLNQDSCSVEHAYEVLSCLERMADPSTD